MTTTLEDLEAWSKRHDTSLQNIHKLLIEQRNDALARDEALDASLKVLGEQLKGFDRNQCEGIGAVNRLQDAVRAVIDLLEKRENIRKNLGAGY